MARKTVLIFLICSCIFSIILLISLLASTAGRPGGLTMLKFSKGSKSVRVYYGNAFGNVAINVQDAYPPMVLSASSPAPNTKFVRGSVCDYWEMKFVDVSGGIAMLDRTWAFDVSSLFVFWCVGGMVLLSIRSIRSEFGRVFRRRWFPNGYRVGFDI